MTFLLLSFLASAAPAETTNQVIIRTESAFDYACMDHQEDYAAIPQAIADFMAEFSRQDLKAAGPLLGIYLNFAADTAGSDLKWQIGLPITSETKPKPPLLRGRFEKQEVVHILRQGPYDTVGETYRLLQQTINEKGYRINGPAWERYLSDPAQVAPQETLTEIFIPIRKKD